ncbi:cob(I)yrinic acid a,c-diamide adenosyltransferase [Candidatus Saccharibacteria bacterium]|nr:cob(I)yrinic acid a,c-diamide adenosyltransferase [Candidatus Saccharibacteria bacterium]
MEKQSIVLVYTGDGKGKTSAAIGLLARALGAGKRIAFVQFIKAWEVSEHKFFAAIAPLYNEKFTFYKGGKGFFNAGKASAKNVSDAEHRTAAHDTFDFAITAAISGDYDLVICDEINNAVADGLLTTDELKKLIEQRAEKTSLCLTGRNFPDELIELVDIVTEMKKIKHHYDDGFLAQEGIDF